MTSDFPDIHHKMSKKIAQLTKVIFHLNTQNDEHEQYQQALSSVYEREIDQIVSQANSIINRQKEVLDKYRQAGDPQMVITGIQKQFEEAKTRAQTELAIIRRKAEEREATVTQTAKQQVEEMKAEVRQLKEAAQRQFQQFEGKQVTSASALDELRRAHQKEMDTFVKEHNAKYSQLLQAKLDSEDALKEEMTNSIKKLNAEWESRMKKLQEEMESRMKKAVEDAKLREAEAFQKIIDRNNAQTAKQIEDLQAKLADSESQKSKSENYVLDLQNQVKKLNLLVSEWEKKYRKLSDEYQSLENDRSATGLQAAKLGSELTDIQSEIQKLRDQIRTKEKTISVMSKEYEEMMASFRKEIASLSANASDKEMYLRTELENKGQRIEGLQHEVYLLNKNVRDM